MQTALKGSRLKEGVNPPRWRARRAASQASCHSLGFYHMFKPHNITGTFSGVFLTHTFEDSKALLLQNKYNAVNLVLKPVFYLVILLKYNTACPFLRNLHPYQSCRLLFHFCFNFGKLYLKKFFWQKFLIFFFFPFGIYERGNA